MIFQCNPCSMESPMLDGFYSGCKVIPLVDLTFLIPCGCNQIPCKSIIHEELVVSMSSKQRMGCSFYGDLPMPGSYIEQCQYMSTSLPDIAVNLWNYS